MRLQPFLLSAALAGNAFSQKMSDRFTLSSTCDSTKMDSVLSETLDMVDAALKALNTLLTANINPKLSNDATENLILAAQRTWGVAQPTWLTFRWSSADKTQLTTAQSKTIESELFLCIFINAILTNTQ